MKKESEIYQEIERLNKCIEDRKEYISSNYVDSESKSLYKDEVKELENDIKRLEWVLEDNIHSGYIEDNIHFRYIIDYSNYVK